MSAHTPGPWVVDGCPDAHDYTTVRPAGRDANGDTDKQPIATVYAVEDADIIAAAPAMLEALRALVRDVTECGLLLVRDDAPIVVSCNAAKAAIAAAEGRT